MKLTICLLIIACLLIYLLFLRKTGKLGEPSYTGNPPEDMLGTLPVGERFYETIIKDLPDEWHSIFKDLYPGGA